MSAPPKVSCAVSATLRPLVVVATKGRPEETRNLLLRLAEQVILPELVVVVGTQGADFPKPEPLSYSVAYVVSDRAGLTSQRNAGIAKLQSEQRLGPSEFVAFFDDDFRPAPDWLREAGSALKNVVGLVGLTGHVLADGVGGDRISEQDAQDFVAGRRPPKPHWSSPRGRTRRPVKSLYGCNMAVTTEVARLCCFDEELPLYGWQEDCDFTGQARRLGSTEVVPACRGVHLGVTTARTSGLRMGYSQLANPIRIAGRGNMPPLRSLRFIVQALAANLGKTLLQFRNADYQGRLKGNLIALGDLLAGRCHPSRILELGNGPASKGTSHSRL